MTVLSKEDAFAWLEFELRRNRCGERAYAGALRLVEEHARDQPEDDMSDEIRISQKWLDRAIERVGLVQGLLDEKRTEAAEAFAMALHERLGDESVANKLPTEIVAMIFKLYFY
jgi:hypothetical protein